jgi:hypothetical protein
MTGDIGESSRRSHWHWNELDIAQLRPHRCGCMLIGCDPFRDVLGVSAYAASFAQFVECGVPATLTAQVNAHQTANGIPPLSVTVTMSQMGVTCGTTTILLALPAGD